MARRPRIHFPGALYHVITRGNRRQGILLDEKDVKKFLVYLGDYKCRHPFRIYAYALMKNHLAYLAKTVSDHMVKEIVDHFKRSPATIGEGIIKVEDLLGKDKRFGNMLTFMGENLIKGRKRKYGISVASPHC